MHLPSRTFETWISWALRIRFSSIAGGGNLALGVFDKFVAREQDENLQVATLRECWSAGVLERWSTGALECWSAGVVEYWSTGVLEYWSTGVVEYRSAGVVKYWSAGVVERSRPPRFFPLHSATFVRIIVHNAISAPDNVHRSMPRDPLWEGICGPLEAFGAENAGRS